MAAHLYEDLYERGYSPKLKERVDAAACVLNVAGATRGVKARRGDGTFGAVVPNVHPLREQEFHVLRGPVALTQISVEVKIIATARLAQVGRVINDLEGSAKALKEKSRAAVTVAITGVNYSERYTGFEGERKYPIDRAADRARRESEQTCARLEQAVRPAFDELILFMFKATNRPPFPFSWLRASNTEEEYGSALVRIARLYDERF